MPRQAATAQVEALMDNWAELPRPSAGASTPVSESLATSPHVKRLIELYQKWDDIEAETKMVEEMLRADVHHELVCRSMLDGVAHRAIHIGTMLTYVCQNRYRQLSTERELEEARSVYGERFKEYFQGVYSIKVKSDKIPPALRQMIFDAVFSNPPVELDIPIQSVTPAMRDGLKEAGVKPTVVFKPTEAYHTKAILDPQFPLTAKPVSYLQRRLPDKE